MGAFGKKNQWIENQEAAECDRQLAALEGQLQQTYLHIGRTYAENNPAEKAKGTPYEEDIAAIEKLQRDMEYYEKRKLAMQGLRKCEKCGNILSADSLFCNKCGEKIPPLFGAEEGGHPVCSRCGAPYEEDAVFCIHCGNKLH